MTNKFLIGNSIVGISRFNGKDKISNCITVHFFPAKIQFTFVATDDFANTLINFWIFGIDLGISLGWVPVRRYLAHIYNALIRKG